MPPGTNESQETKSESGSESKILDKVLDKNRMTQIRREIGMIADRSHRENLISDEAYEGYQKLAGEREEHEMDAEMLESTRKFAREHEEKAIRVHQKIQNAVSHRIASEKDEEFLMEKLVIENIKFNEQAGEIEGLIDQKLARMKTDKEKYDKLAGHRLIKDIGYLKVDGNTRIKFPSEEEFLAMKVPERRTLLKSLEDAMPKAEAHAKECEATEDKEMLESYRSKLDAALKEGIIGRHTYESFLNGFLKIDFKEKEYWDKEFDSQMKRYRTLWGQIRETLKGQALEKMEGMIDEAGYTQLLSKFGQLRNAESSRLNLNYKKDLEAYRQQGLIGQHTIAQFMQWMSEQSLAEKYDAGEKLPEQMKRYEALWQNVAELPAKQQGFLRSKIDLWGYTELNKKYQEFIGKPQEDDDSESNRILNGVQSGEVRQAIIDTGEMLDKRGTSKKKSFMGLMDKMFSRANRDTFDATSFETEVREKAVKLNPDMKQDLKGRDANDKVDFEQIEEDAGMLEEAGSADLKEESGFIEVRSGSGTESSRHTQVTINAERGLDRLMSEDAKKSYQAEEAGGRDDLSLAVSNSGRTVELEMKEVRTLDEYLKQTEKKDQLDKAA